MRGYQNIEKNMYFPVFGQESYEIEKVKTSMHVCVQVGLKVHVNAAAGRVRVEVICGSKSVERRLQNNVGYTE